MTRDKVGRACISGLLTCAEHTGPHAAATAPGGAQLCLGGAVQAQSPGLWSKGLQPRSKFLELPMRGCPGYRPPTHQVQAHADPSRPPNGRKETISRYWGHLPPHFPGNALGRTLLNPH